MFLGIGNIVALVSIIISIILAVGYHQTANPLWWALVAIFAVLWWDARAPWGRPIAKLESQPAQGVRRRRGAAERPTAESAHQAPKYDQSIKLP